MTEFKVGDRVKYVGRNSIFFESALMNRYGTVAGNNTSPDSVDVDWDGFAKGHWGGVYPDNIELAHRNLVPEVAVDDVDKFSIDFTRIGTDATGEVWTARDGNCVVVYKITPGTGSWRYEATSISPEGFWAKAFTREGIHRKIYAAAVGRR